MANLTERVRQRVERDFGDSAIEVRRLIDAWEILGEEPSERLVAAAVLGARGDVSQLRAAIELSRIDWRDLLMGSGLEHEDWPDVLVAEFGT
jgi:hypothetical protein